MALIEQSFAWSALILTAAAGVLLVPLFLTRMQPRGQPPHLTYKAGMLEHLRRLDLVSVLELATRHDPVVRLGVWPACMVVVTGANNLKQVLSGEYDWAPALWPPSTRVMLDLDSVTHVTGDTHRWMRRVFLQAFSSARLRQLAPALVQLAQDYCSRWATSSCALDLALEVKAFTFEVIARLANGLALTPVELEHCAQLFGDWQQALFVVPANLPGTAFRRGLLAKRRLMAYFEPHLRRMWHLHHGRLPPLQREPGAQHGSQEPDAPAAARAGAAEGLVEAGSAAGAQQGPQQQHEGQGNAARAVGGAGAGSQGTGSGASLSSSSDSSVINGMLKSGFSWEQLRGNCFQMFFAGHDTSSATVTALLWYLGQAPHVVERLLQEQRRLLQAHGPQLSWEALEDMEYAKCCIKEALRLMPVVGAVFRRAAKSFQVGQHQVARGSIVMCFLRGTVTNDSRWPPPTPQQQQGDPGQERAHAKGGANGGGETDSCRQSSAGAEATAAGDQPGALDPGAFNPDRWLDPSTKVAGDWVPFGSGPRMCPGYPLAFLEIKVLLAVMLRSCSWSLEDPQAVRWATFPIPRPQGGLWARFQPRAAL